MPSNQARYPALLAVKLDPKTAADLKRLAQEDDRTVSAFVRRLLWSAVTERTDR